MLKLGSFSLVAADETGASAAGSASRQELRLPTRTRQAESEASRTHGRRWSLAASWRWVSCGGENALWISLQPAQVGRKIQGFRCGPVSIGPKVGFSRGGQKWQLGQVWIRGGILHNGPGPHGSCLGEVFTEAVLGQGFKAARRHYQYIFSSAWTVLSGSVLVRFTLR